jgi:hypothetical protein
VRILNVFRCHNIGHWNRCDEDTFIPKPLETGPQGLFDAEVIDFAKSILVAYVLQIEKTHETALATTKLTRYGDSAE